MIWLGNRRGYLADWITQRWVQYTGRRVRFSDLPWLDGPVGDTRGIGRTFFDTYAARNGLRAVHDSAPRGLLRHFGELAGPQFDPSQVHPAVVRFYEETSEYTLDAWSHWCGVFRPFGALLALLFSRRLQQLNVPLSPLDTSHGVSSEVVELLDAATGHRVAAAWIRQLISTKNLLYAGSYSVTEVPGFAGRCVKVVFPLPNGNCIVMMKPSADAEGSFTVSSSGRRFGDPGFYFTVHAGDGTGWARYVRTLRESIRVDANGDGVLHAEHDLWIWRTRFLRLHYRLARSSMNRRRNHAVS